MKEGVNQVREKDQMCQQKRMFLIINYSLLLFIGTTGGPLITRLYFIHGGRRAWFTGLLHSVGFLIHLVPLLFSYVRTGKPFFSINSYLFIASSIMGLLVGLEDYLYTYGLACLPASTSSLILTVELGLTAVFAFFIVGHKFSAFSIVAVVLLSMGAAVLALHASGDMPEGVSKGKYLMGFVMTLGSSVLTSFSTPLMELVYGRSKQPLTYLMVIQAEFIMSVTGTLFCAVGMLVNNDFKVMGKEAREFGLGEMKYYVVALCMALIWQIYLLGAIGVIFYASSFLSGIIIAVSLPFTEVLAVIFFREKFTVGKGISLAFSLSGFMCYFYGEYKQLQKQKQDNPTHDESELLPILASNI